EKFWAFHTRLVAVCEYPARASASESLSALIRAGARTETSAKARLRPLAPVGGTVWALSPARNSEPCCIGSVTAERNGSTVLSVIVPVLSSKPSGPATRDCSSVQIRSSDQSAASVPGEVWKYMRWTVSLRWEMSATPRSEREETSTSWLAGASQRMPNQAKGYSWKYRCRVVSGIIARQGPREPSEPTTYRASMRSSSPSTVVAATQGRSLSISPRRVSDTE